MDHQMPIAVRATARWGHRRWSKRRYRFFRYDLRFADGTQVYDLDGTDFDLRLQGPAVLRT